MREENYQLYIKANKWSTTKVLHKELRIFFFLMFIYFWERENVRAWGEGAESGRHRIWSRLYAVSTEPNVGLELVNWEIMTWAEVRRLTNWATQATPPMSVIFTFLLHASLFSLYHTYSCDLSSPFLTISISRAGPRPNHFLALCLTLSRCPVSVCWAEKLINEMS